jgi:hypothetical protein
MTITTELITLIAIPITLFIIGLIDAFKPQNRPKLGNTILMWCLVILVYPFACVGAMYIEFIIENWPDFNQSLRASDTLYNMFFPGIIVWILWLYWACQPITACAPRIREAKLNLCTLYTLVFVVILWKTIFP